MTTATATATRPRWATLVAVGLLVCAFGAFVLAAGLLTGAPGVFAIGSAALALGATVSLLGGFSYFIAR